MLTCFDAATGLALEELARRGLAGSAGTACLQTAEIVDGTLRFRAQLSCGVRLIVEQAVQAVFAVPLCEDATVVEAARGP